MSSNRSTKSKKMVSQMKYNSSDIKFHAAIGLFARILLSAYSIFHDRYFQLPYTDIDYKVYTFAAKEVAAQRSPYNHPSYRYSPIIAYLFTPNIFVHPIIGKLLASISDVLLALCIYKIIGYIYNNQKKSLLCAQLWLYNPLPIIICTRGNVDSFSSIFILLSLWYQLKQNYLASGALLGLSVHLRLYPIVFVLPFLFTAGRFTADDTLKLTYKHKLKFAAAFVLSLGTITGAFYYVYGQKFIDASFVYHLFRVDTRHNFSLYFYLQYLEGFIPDYISKNLPLLNPKLTKNLLILVPSVALLIAVTFKYNTLNHLPFAMFCSAFIFVIFNRVLTSQYFIWYLSLLPLFLPAIFLSTKKVISIVSLWIGTQALWLAGAYLLEFKGLDTFIYIHGCSVFFYFVNVWILYSFLNSYNAQYTKKVK